MMVAAFAAGAILMSCIAGVFMIPILRQAMRDVGADAPPRDEDEGGRREGGA